MSTPADEMNLYTLERIDKSTSYGVCDAGVVAAKNEDRARELMSIGALDEGSKLWLDSKRSSCSILSSTLERIIITDCDL